MNNRGGVIDVQYHMVKEGSRFAIDVSKRGHALLSDSLLNKGTAFSLAERELFGLEGLLPAQVTNSERQVRRAYENILAKGDHPLERYIGMAALQDRNETLFYQVLAAHIEQLLPVVYTPTVGEAATRYSRIFRRGRGVWITPDHRGRMYEVLGHLRSKEVKLIVATDNERILGLGDQGAGGMVIPIGKLALYTVAAGIHPAHTLPVSLDFGTDNEELLRNDLYVGWRHRRLRGKEYFELLDEFVDAVKRRFPGVLLQWEDFKKANAFDVLIRYRDELASFNDDIQGTAGVALAAVLAAGRATSTRPRDQRFVIAGAGAAGVGIAGQIRTALAADGVSGEDLLRAIALVDSTGLLQSDRSGMEPHKAEFSWPPLLVKEAGLDHDAGLVRTIDAVKPTVLIGTTGRPGLFTHDVIKTMARHVDRPVVMPLSNPTSKCEGRPSDIVGWTEGRAIIATGSPSEPVTYRGRTIHIAQGNNVYVFPGVGLGSIVAGVEKVTDGMFTAAAAELASRVDEEDLGRGVLYPPIGRLRELTGHVAAAVVRQARDDGIGAQIPDDEVDAAVADHRWDLDYPILRPV